jgi:FeS assembly SUF system regulator
MVLYATKKGWGNMLRISKLTDYATVIMSYLALNATQVASATHIAKEIRLGAPTVSKILKILCEAHLVTSYRGTGGGYQLARSSSEITVADIVSAIEGNLAMTECCSGKNLCALDSLCSIKENWQIINKIILTALSGLTLAQMTKPISQKQFKLHGIPINVEKT